MDFSMILDDLLLIPGKSSSENFMGILKIANVNAWEHQAYTKLQFNMDICIAFRNPTGPLNQATGPPQSDAGVGIGMLIGDRDSFTWK